MKTRTPSQPGPSATALQAKESCLRPLFDEFYPSIFAYVASALEDAADVPEAVAEAFAIAFQETEGADAHTFRLHLFQVTHDLVVSPVSRWPRRRGRLSDDERQLLALVFDGGLPPAAAASILRLTRLRMGELLLSGLRKLQVEARAAAVA